MHVLLVLIMYHSVKAVAIDSVPCGTQLHTVLPNLQDQQVIQTYVHTTDMKKQGNTWFLNEHVVARLLH